MELRAELQEFLNRWNAIVFASPELALDGGWESIGVVDLILAPLRNRAVTTTDEFRHEFVFRALTLYCGELLCRMWETLNLHTEVTTTDSEACLISLKDERLNPIGAIPLGEILGDAFAADTKPVMIWDSFQRFYSEEENLLSDLLRGVLFLRLTGRYELKASRELLKDVEVALERAIARSCVTRYSQIYPEEETGQIGDLYFGGILTRSDYVDNGAPLESVIVEYFQEISAFSLPAKRLISMGENFTRSPEPRLVGLGFTLACALFEGDRSAPLETASLGMGIRSAHYRRAIQKIRERDATSVLSETRFIFERTVGLLPWLWCGPAVLQYQSQEARVVQFFEALTALDHGEVFRTVEQLVEERPGWSEFRIQHIGMLLGGGRYEDIPRLCKVLLTEPGMESDPRVHRLWGLALIRLGHVGEGVSRLEYAFRNATPGVLEFSNIANDFAYGLMLQGRFTEALPVLQDGIQRVPSAIYPRMNRYRALKELSSFAEAQAERDRLVALAPTNRGVFRLAFLES